MEEAMSREYDEYGDSYYDDVDWRDVRRLMKRMKKPEETGGGDVEVSCGGGSGGGD